uniref:Uncharacterized protein n=1 Tax=Ananas comosus var. bracteatus TaxID=296719 RepID=A0A6V7Q615_ANACO|nr:unnamed protein product [Ananas comosus var. bracteatus]
MRGLHPGHEIQPCHLRRLPAGAVLDSSSRASSGLPAPPPCAPCGPASAWRRATRRAPPTPTRVSGRRPSSSLRPPSRQRNFPRIFLRPPRHPCPPEPPSLGQRDAFTTFQLLTAFIWKARVVALRLPPEEEATLAAAVDARKRLSRRLPAGYYGNVLAFPAATTTVEKLSKNQLGYAAELIKKAVGAVDDEYVQSTADLLVLRGRSHAMGVNPFFVSNLTQLGLEKVDFGWGRAVFAGPAAGPTQGSPACAMPDGPVVVYTPHGNPLRHPIPHGRATVACRNHHHRSPNLYPFISPWPVCRRSLSTRAPALDASAALAAASVAAAAAAVALLPLLPFLLLLVVVLLLALLLRRLREILRSIGERGGGEVSCLIESEPAFKSSRSIGFQLPRSRSIAVTSGHGIGGGEEGEAKRRGWAALWPFLRSAAEEAEGVKLLRWRSGSEGGGEGKGKGRHWHFLSPMKAFGLR